MSNNLKPRNFVAQSPLLRKGGVHQKSASAKRQHVRMQTRIVADDWREELEFEREMASIISSKDGVDDGFIYIHSASLQYAL